MVFKYTSLCLQKIHREGEKEEEKEVAVERDKGREGGSGREVLIEGEGGSEGERY